MGGTAPAIRQVVQVVQMTNFLENCTVAKNNHA